MAVKRLVLEDFSGGVDTLGPPSRIGSPLLPHAINATSRGRSIVQRFGTTLRGTPTATAQYVFFSKYHDSTIFVQEGASLYRYSLSPYMSARTLVRTWSTSDKIAMCDFVSTATPTLGSIMVHPVDGVYFVSTAFAVTGPFGAPVKGSCCAVWQNKVWVAGDPSFTSRVWWSNEGRGDVYTTATDFVDVREIDNELITAIGVGNGMDVIGRAGLFTFKQMSSYVIIDSETGEYVTLDGHIGAMGPESVTSGPDGVYVANNLAVGRITSNGVVDIHDPIASIWDDPNIGYAAIIAWTSWNRVYFSIPADGYIFEYVPSRGNKQGAWWIHALNKNNVQKGVLSATSSSAGASGLQAPQPYLLDGDGTRVLDMWLPSEGRAQSSSPAVQDYEPGDTSPGPYPVTMKFRIPWLTDGNQEFRVERVLVRGWGGGTNGTAVTPTIYSNYGTSATARTALTLGSSLMGEDAEAIINQLGVHRAFQLQFASSGTEADNFPNPDPENSINVKAGAAGISAIEIEVIPL